jgi:hypothetical protein
MKFPKDANGDVLRRMQKAGFDFSKPHSVEFFAVMSTEKEADIIAKQYVKDRECGDTLDNIETRPCETGGMELILAKTMMVTYENITAFEKKLQKRVSAHEGYLDGWGVLVRE